MNADLHPRTLVEPQSAGPRVEVALLGQKKGRSTLLMAIREMLRPPQEVEESRPASFQQVEWQLGGRHYALVDGDRTSLQQAQGAVLLFSAADGPTDESNEGIRSAREAGIRRVQPYVGDLDKVDDPELVDLTEMEFRNHLSEQDYPGDDLKFLRGSASQAVAGDQASRAAIRALVEAVEAMA